MSSLGQGFNVAVWVEDICVKDKWGKRFVGNAEIKLDEYISTINITVFSGKKIKEKHASVSENFWLFFSPLASQLRSLLSLASIQCPFHFLTDTQSRRGLAERCAH